MKVNLEEILSKQDKSLYWLAEKTKVGYPNLYNLAKNKTSSIKFDILERICAALECTPSDILKIESNN